jgi:uncharacterized oxidoreductase
MEEAMAGITVPHTALRELVRQTLEALGSERAEATTVADHLVEANLAGHDSHGVGLLPMYVRDFLAGNLLANRHPELVRDDDVIGVFDAGLGFGHVAAKEVTEWGMARARQRGAAIMSLRNAYHIARVGSYGEQACAAGLISIFFVNVVAGGLQKVAPFGGSDGRLHTNPICIGIPAGADQHPILLDFATSHIAMGKVRVAYNEGRTLEHGSLIDGGGRDTGNPAVIFEEPYGAILPFGAHKGSGLALACELLAGALSGGPTNQSTAPRSGGLLNNMLAIIIDPARFTELPYLNQEIAAVLAHVKASPAASPEKPVLTAGEPERARRRIRLETGIPIDDKSWADILAAAKDAGLEADVGRPEASRR